MIDLGGTLFNNAYTPGPDTPRASGCLWSSRYPKFNGCNTRIKYPYYYLNDKDNFLAILKNNNYKFNIYINNCTKETGLLPKGIENKAIFSDDLSFYSFLEGIKIFDNSLTFVYLSDYHLAVSQYNANLNSHNVGCNYTLRALQTIDDIIGFKSFDLTIIFSDHGFKLYNERNDCLLDRFGDNRLKILLYVLTNKKSSFRINNDLHSIMDIGPTILNFCNLKVPYKIDGIDLLGNKSHNYIVLEDHRLFTVDLNQNIEFYAVKENKDLTVFDCHLNYESTCNKINLNKYIKILSKNASNFDENVKQQKILDAYKNEIKSNNKYFDGKIMKNKGNVFTALKKIVKKPIKALIKKYNI